MFGILKTMNSLNKRYWSVDTKKYQIPLFLSWSNAEVFFISQNHHRVTLPMLGSQYICQSARKGQSYQLHDMFCIFLEIQGILGYKYQYYG